MFLELLQKTFKESTRYGTALNHRTISPSEHVLCSRHPQMFVYSLYITTLEILLVVRVRRADYRDKNYPLSCHEDMVLLLGIDIKRCYSDFCDTDFATQKS